MKLFGCETGEKPAILVKGGAGYIGSHASKALALAPTVPLPAAVMSRKKTGFGTPLARWMPAAAGAPASVSTYSYVRPWARHVLRHQLPASAPIPMAA
jgi:hypothetical protein